MPSALRNTVAGGAPAPTLLEWLRSDGTGYIDTGFVVSDYKTKYIIEAACLSINPSYNPLVMAGATTSMNNTNESCCGFGAFYNDRQIFLRRGHNQFWNSSGNNGNWNGGQFHVLETSLSGQTSATASVDGVNIPMSVVSFGQSLELPPDSQTVFASKTNGVFTLLNSAYKVRRVAYALDGVMLAEFRAAIAKDAFGMYDIISGVFHPGAGGFTAGSGIS